MQSAHEVAVKGVFEEGSFVVGLQFDKGWLTGKRIDHQLTVNFGPGGPFNRTLFIKAEGVCPIISSHSMIKLIKLSYPKHIDLVPNEMEHI